MTQTIRAIYENGIFKPIERINLPQHQEVEIIVPHDISGKYITFMAERGGSFDFLADQKEDIYTINDGEPL
ncbi:MAG TPA: antitoxin family protein [Syntrophorhabdus sp.]|nr:antitoxin family protein [Syntrophorhabdus sp.]